MIEPVERLRGRNEIYRSVGQARRLGARQPVFDFRIWSRSAELISARIDGDDPLEMIHQAERGLPVTGSAVEREPMLRRQSGQTVKEPIGIPRAKGGVERRAI